MLGPSLRMEKIWSTATPGAKIQTEQAFLTISRSKTFLEELIHMTTKQTKEKAEACKHTQMIPMLKTKNK